VRAVIFVCPVTHMNVQHWLNDDEAEDGRFSAAAASPSASTTSRARRPYGPPGPDGPEIHRRQVADVAVEDPKKTQDRSLVGRDRIQVTHSFAQASSRGDVLSWVPWCSSV
jgi:hypothetical protein